MDDKNLVLMIGRRDSYTEDFFKKISEESDVKFLEKPDPTEEEIIKEIGNADVLIYNARTYVSKRIIDSGKKLKAIVLSSVGFDQIDVDSVTNKGILVVNTPSADDVVAEGTILFMIALAKQFPRLVDAAKKGIRVPTMKENIELFGKTLGIIGAGRIGSRVAQIANAMGMKVIAYSPHATARYARLLQISSVDLATLLRESDFVSIHCPLAKETRHMIGEKELGLMKKTAFLINTARGEVVDEGALYQCLKEGKIAGAGLDVFEVEPLKPDNPLLTLNNTICTAHSISGSVERSMRMEKMVLDSVLRVLRGTLPLYIANPKVLDRLLKQD
jgi:phosphoglycerate dehydrogenase-like enzyme